MLMTDLCHNSMPLAVAYFCPRLLLAWPSSEHLCVFSPGCAASFGPFDQHTKVQRLILGLTSLATSLYQFSWRPEVFTRPRLGQSNNIAQLRGGGHSQRIQCNGCLRSYKTHRFHYEKQATSLSIGVTLDDSQKEKSSTNMFDFLALPCPHFLLPPIPQT